MSNNIQLFFFLDDDQRRRQVSRARQVNTADTIAASEILKFKMFTAGFLYIRSPKPCHAGTLLDIAVLCQKFRFFRQRFICCVDLIQDKIHRYRNAQIRKAFPQLIDVIPFIHIIDHVNKRQQPFFSAVALQE